MSEYDLTKRIYDFKDVLAKMCLGIKPKRILEWGPGYSTKLMNECCPKAEIISIESNEKWYKVAKENFPFADIRLVPSAKDHEEYATYPWKQNLGKFDLIFVDGFSRTACLVVSSLILNKKGAIVMHNAKSAKYQPIHKVMSTLGFTGVGSRTKVIRRTKKLGGGKDAL